MQAPMPGYSGLLWAPVAFGTGIGLYFALPVEPGTGWLIAGVIAALAMMALGVRGRWIPPVLLALAILGGVRAGYQTRLTTAPVLKEVYWGPVSGRVAGLDRSSSNRVRLWLDRVHMPGVSDPPRYVRLVLAADPPPEVTRPGALVMAMARLTPPPEAVEPGGFDFRRHAWFQRLGAIGFAPKPVLLQRPEPDGQGLGLLRLRMTLADAIRDRMPERTGPFAAAILTGDRSAIAPENLVDLRASNLAHLLAISGLHMGLLTGFVFLIVRLALSLVPPLALRWQTKKVASAVALAAGLGYLAISGASVATQRAFIMAAVVLLAVMLDRPALTLRAVAIAALIVLAIRPESLLGPGFQMSFAATVALIACFEWLKRFEPWQNLDRGWRRWARGALVVVITSAVAGAATAPFAAMHFNQIPQYGLLANVLAVPAMGFLVMPAAVLTLLLMPLGLSGVGFRLMDLGIAHILSVAAWVGGFEDATIPVASPPSWIAGVLAMALAAWVILRGRNRLAAGAAAVAALAAWSAHDRPDILISGDGRLVGVLGDDGRMLNRGRGAGFAARVWLENDGDPVSQRTASLRLGAGPAISHRIGAQHVRVLADGSEIGTSCQPQTLLILASEAGVAHGPCILLDAAHLARSGATAVYLGDKLRIATVAESAGLRPWTGYIP